MTMQARIHHRADQCDRMTQNGEFSFSTSGLHQEMNNSSTFDHGPHYPKTHRMTQKKSWIRACDNGITIIEIVV